MPNDERRLEHTERNVFKRRAPGLAISIRRASIGIHKAPERCCDPSKVLATLPSRRDSSHKNKTAPAARTTHFGGEAHMPLIVHNIHHSLWLELLACVGIKIAARVLELL